MGEPNSCCLMVKTCLEVSVPMIYFFSPPDFDANNIFKAFFGGPGGFSFEGNVCICVQKLSKKLGVLCWAMMKFFFNAIN